MMSKVTFKGSPVSVAGNFPAVGTEVKDFKLVTNDLKETALSDFDQELIVLNIFPSIDTPVCSSSVLRFNTEAGKIPKALVLCISKDLPFAQARFCGAENVENVKTLSAFRNPEFAQQLGVDIADGLLKGLLSRAVIVLDAQRKVIYNQLVPELTDKPDYDKCLSAIASLTG